MTNEELLRYSRHILLPQLGIEGQARLSQACIMIVGLGGLGSPVAMYLAAAGVGSLLLVDDDKVELSNLQRQIIHTQSHLGACKVDSAAACIAELNSLVSVTGYAHRFNAQTFREILPRVTVLVDCTDNFSSREAINHACFSHKVPLVSAAATGFEAQLCSFDFRDRSSSCYRCLYDQLDDTQLSCAQSGVCSAVLGIAGSMQALEALKIAAGLAPSMTGRLLLFDALNAVWRSLKTTKKPDCSICTE